MAAQFTMYLRLAIINFVLQTSVFSNLAWYDTWPIWRFGHQVPQYTLCTLFIELSWKSPELLWCFACLVKLLFVSWHLKRFVWIPYVWFCEHFAKITVKKLATMGKTLVYTCAIMSLSKLFIETCHDILLTYPVAERKFKKIQDKFSGKFL